MADSTDSAADGFPPQALEGQLGDEMKAIIEALQEGFALFDADDRLIYCNSKYRAVFPAIAELIRPGVLFEDLIRGAAARGQYVEALLDTEAWIQQRLAAHRADGSGFEHRFTDGRWMLAKERRTADGKMLSTYVDITQLKHREDELIQARKSAEAASRIKSEFLAKVSHELRTPLNAIIGFSEIMVTELMGPMGSDHYRDYAKDIHVSGEHLLDIVNDLLDLAKVESGKLDLREDAIGLEELFSNCQRFFVERAIAAGIALTATWPEEPVTLLCDQVRIKQILINLLSNAVKFTPQGGTVALEAKIDSDGGILMTVTDSGIGMSRADLDVALESFRQVDNALDRDQGGTGLGLPLTKSLVELHGGFMSIGSRPNEGTKVTIGFPRERVGEPSKQLTSA